MEYKLNEEKENVVEESGNVELIKQNLVSLLALSEQEKTALSSIQDAIELSAFLDKPEQYLSDVHAIELKEVLELIDLLGGIYLA